MLQCVDITNRSSQVGRSVLSEHPAPWQEYRQHPTRPQTFTTPIAHGSCHYMEPLRLSQHTHTTPEYVPLAASTLAVGSTSTSASRAATVTQLQHPFLSPPTL
jgi:hypothetical protein